jgi:very-short-patch-repair endonuclease
MKQNTRFTLKDAQVLLNTGKIRGYSELVVKKNALPEVGGRKVGKHFSRKSKGLDYIAKNIFYWCQAKALVLEEEYKFHPERKWRFDFAIPSLKCAVEFNGGVFDRNGSHTSLEKIGKDNEKLNAASVLGWKVLRYTADDYESLVGELDIVFNLAQNGI